jgi:hypothetical protein
MIFCHCSKENVGGEMGRTEKYGEIRLKIQKLRKQEHPLSQKSIARKLNVPLVMVSRWCERSGTKELSRAKNRLGTGIFNLDTQRAIVELRRLLRCSYGQMVVHLNKYVAVLSTHSIGTGKIPKLAITRSNLDRICKHYVKLPKAWKHWGPGDVAAHAVRLAWTEGNPHVTGRRKANEENITTRHAWLLVFACRWEKALNHDWKIERHIFADVPNPGIVEDLLVEYVRKHRASVGVEDVTIHLVTKPGPVPEINISNTSLRRRLRRVTVVNDEATLGMPGEITITPALSSLDDLRNRIDELIHGKEIGSGLELEGQPIRKLVRRRKYTPRKKTKGVLATKANFPYFWTEGDRRHALLREYLATNTPNSREVARSIRPLLEAFLRVACPEHFPPGTLLGPFRHLCEQRVNTGQEILDATDTLELRELLEYANRFHHDTNPAWEAVIINDGELAGFVQRALNFAMR